MTRAASFAPALAVTLAVTLAATAALLGGCREGARTVAVRASVPGLDSAETPVAQLEVVALPYDRDSLRAAFEAKAPPRPSTAALDSLLDRFRGPFRDFTAATVRTRALEDSLARDSTGPGAARLRAALAAATRTRDSAGRALDVVRRELRLRDSTLRAPLRHWQDNAFRGWDSVTHALVERSGHQPVVDTTNATGWATLRLPAGQWWIWATSLDVDDPNSRWYWNVPVRGDTVRLDSRSGHRQRRY
ncbi:MAG TPA: hypothetical protein VFS40_01830 [Gemmatimonadales bacterium]|nr:hypothetical protein [Gemmatimonadales bacterium]